MDVEYADLHLGAQVLARQADPHLVGMNEYIKAHCKLSAQDMGQILSVFQPLNEGALDIAHGVLSGLGVVYQGSARGLDETVARYAEADYQSYLDFAAVFTALGLIPPPYQDPLANLPALPPAASTSGEGYGAQPGDPGQRALALAQSESEGLVEDPARALSRAGAAMQADPSVEEARDVLSYLVAPQTPHSPIQDMRWDAGALLGSLDWVFEQLAGYSFLEERIFKPFSGDWDRIGAASTAWSHVDDALVAMGSNTTGLVRSMATWTGAGSVAFLAKTALVGGVTTALSFGAGVMSQCLSAIELMSETIASLIGEGLKFLSEKLTQMAAKASFPAVGWVLAAADALSLIDEIIDTVRDIVDLTEALVETVETAVEGRDKLSEIGYQVADIVEGMFRGSIAQAVA